MKRFLGIFATALLFLFLFTFFGGSYFLDIQHHFYAWMFPVSLGMPSSSGRSGGWTTK